MPNKAGAFVNLYLHVVAHKMATMGEFLDFHPGIHGSNISEKNKIRVNLIDETINGHSQKAYSIVYRADDFKDISRPNLMLNIIRLFNNNLPGVGINMMLSYHYLTDEDIDLFDPEVGQAILEMNQFCKKMDQSGQLPIFQYGGLTGEDDIDEDCYLHEEEPEEEDDEEDTPSGLGWLFGDDDPDDNGEDEDDPNDPFGFLKDDDEKKSSKKKKASIEDFIGRSKVVKNAKNPKRDINRHGVVIAKKKSDIEKDREVIKQFLKVFIPGNKEWIKEFRKDVLRRWVTMYAISRKDLNKMQKKHMRHKKAAQQKGYGAFDRGLQLTKKLMTSPIDRWSDPNL